MTFHLLLFAKSHQTSCRNVQRRDETSLVCCNLHSKCKQNFTGGKKKDAAWMWRWSGYCFYLLFAFWESQTYFARLHNSPETTHTYIHTLHKLYLTRDPISWLATSRSRPFPCAQTYMFVAGLIWSIYDIWWFWFWSLWWNGKGPVSHRIWN